MKLAATLASFADFRIVKTRKLAQFVFEIPIEKADEALAALGGLPRSDGERWCGIALVTTGPETVPAQALPPEAEAQGQDKPDKPRRRFSELPRSQQAGMLCADPRFREWLRKRFPWRWAMSNHDAARAVRDHCGITSRSQLDTSAGGTIWDSLVDYYRMDTGQMAEQRA